MQVTENTQYTKDYYDPNKRSIANSVQVFFNDGSCTDKIAIEYPVGHRRRREEGIPLLKKKFSNNICNYFSSRQAETIVSLFENKDKLLAMPVNQLVDNLIV